MLLVYHLFFQLHKATCFERKLKGAKLIENDAQRPYVSGSTVLLLLQQLGRHDDWWSCFRPTLGSVNVADAADSKITDFYDSVFAKENIFGLEIPVYDFPIVDVFQPKAYLNKIIIDFVLSEVLGAIWMLHPPVYFILQVATIDIFHNDIKLIRCFAGEIGLLERDNIRMIQLLHQPPFHLGISHSFFILIFFLVQNNFFNYNQLPRLCFAQVCCTKCSRFQGFLLCVF